MSLLKAEIKASATEFAKDWRAELLAVSASLEAHASVYVGSYERLTSLQAWRVFLEPHVSPSGLAFFLEAQNDSLTSHVFASLGSWRSALKALRACIDNVLFFLYYKDHPVELQLWNAGAHKPTFAELFTYCENHPLRLKEPKIDALPPLRKEYATLSKAVHASAANFRMTKDIKETLLWSDDKIQLKLWESRQRSVLEALNLLLLSHYRGLLEGASAAGLRDSASLAISGAKRPTVLQEMKIVLHDV